MTFRFRAAAAVLAFAVPAAAFAAPTAPGPVTISQVTLGYTYYNRAGADLKLHNADVLACVDEAKRTVSIAQAMHVGEDMGVAGAIFGGARMEADRRGTVASGLENCMVVRGWRVVKLSDQEGKALAALPLAEFSAKLAPWIGAEQPHGDIVRVWANEAASPANKRFDMGPDHVNDGQLSLLAATSAGLKQFTVEQTAASGRGALDPKWPTKALKAEELGSVPPGSAILLVQNKHMSFRNGVAVTFARMGPEIGVFPSSLDHAPDAVAGSNGYITHKGEGVIAIAVPAGRWRVAVLVGHTAINFCLGSPSFEVKAGEVVYAGAFDYAADLTPDLDLTDAKAWLGTLPQAANLRAAVYTNGSRGVCANSAIYALEFRNAPFEPGYNWGSRAAAAQ